MRPTARDIRFAEHLAGLVENGNVSALAVFRRGLGKPPGAVPEMLRWLAPWTAALGLREAGICLQVASLFALYPSAAGEGSMGATCAYLRRRWSDSPGLERRFVALLNCRGEDLPDRLRRFVSMAREAGAPVNWVQLLVDVSLSRCTTSPGCARGSPTGFSGGPAGSWSARPKADPASPGDLAWPSRSPPRLRIWRERAPSLPSPSLLGVT